MAKKVTPEEIGASPELHKHLREAIERYNKQREKGPGEGQRYKRTPYDSLKEKGLFTSKGLALEFNKICNRESKLSHAEREAVVGAVLNAAEKAAKDINLQRERAEKEEAEKATPKKAPKKPRVAPEKKSGTTAQPARKRSTSAKSAENKPEE